MAAKKKKAKLDFEGVVGLAKDYASNPSNNNKKTFLAAARNLTANERKQIPGRIPASTRSNVASVLTF